MVTREEEFSDTLSLRANFRGCTPLHYAVMKGNVEAVLDLLTYSDINIEVQK